MLKITLGKHLYSELDGVYNDGDFIFIYSESFKKTNALYYPFTHKDLPIVIYYQRYYKYSNYTWYELISNYTFKTKYSV